MRNPNSPSPPAYGAIRAAPPPSQEPPRVSPSGYGSIPFTQSDFVKIPAAAPPSFGYNPIPTIATPPPPTTSPSPVSPPSPASRAADLVSRIKEQGQALIAARRPWPEVFHSASFSKPSDFGEAISRIRRNLAYFRANYSIAVLLVLLLSLFWHPTSLFAFAALAAAWFFLYFSRSGPLNLFGRTFDDGTVLATLAGATVILLLFTDVGWNVIGSVLMGIAIVSAHAAFRSTDDLFLDEQEAAGGGLIAGIPAYVRVV
ncbi:PRA1 family protein F2-like [Typha angustifolia]|uniref:PRA1 family protein F2-like n=1 Tax=Typha angustifolia TaxID=59011 RepID=UPI003C2AECEA